MMSTRRSSSLNFTTPLVLEPPRHGGLSSIALVPGRHLIGAADDCSIRLQAEGILDRHAMILVGENRTIVKAIDPRTWVNDGPVTEMALRAGDRLSIGPLTFRVRSAAKDELAAFDVREPQPLKDLSPEPSQAPPAIEKPEPISIAVSKVAVAVASAVETAAVSDLQRDLDQDTPVVDAAITILKTGRDRSAVAEEVVGNVESVEESASAEPLAPAIQQSSPLASLVALETQSSAIAASELEALSARDNTALDRRLDEIQRRLSDLGQAEFSFAAPAEPRVSQPERNRGRARSESQLELNARAEQLAKEASALQQRLEKVAEREALLEQRQQHLVQEAERIAQVAEIARQSLAVEHAEHFSIWQEWEATFQRITGDLAGQLTAFERQRETFRQESQRFQAAQAELLSARAEQERERQSNLADRMKLQDELADLQSLRSQHERLAQQSQRDIDEQGQRVDADRRRLQEERAEVATLKIEFLRQRQVFDLDRSHFDVTRTGMEESLRELQTRWQRAETDLTTWRQKWDTESTALAISRDDDAAKLQELQNRLDEAQRQLQAEQQTVSHLRRDLEVAEQSIRLAPPPQPAMPIPAEVTPVIPATSDHVTSWAIDAAQPEVPETVEGDVPAVSTVAPVGEVALAFSSTDTATGFPAAETRDEATSADMPRYSASSEAFGMVVDWSTLASIEQQFGQAATSSRSTEPQGFGEQLSADAVHEQIGRRLASEDRSIPAAAASSVWPELPAWPIMAPLSPSARIDEPVTVASMTTAKPVGWAAISGDDPWAGFSGGGPDVAATRPTPSLENILDAAMSGGSDSNAVAGPSEFTREAFTQPPAESTTDDQELDARQTLAEVNREFGTAVHEAPSEEVTSALPSWWMENTKPEPRGDEPSGEPGRPSWVIDALRGNDTHPTSDESARASVEEEPPANDLRSQLAKLFELPAQAVSNETAPREQNVPDHPVEETSARPVEVAADAVSESPDRAEETHGEDSVDAFMARLLARSRGGNSDAAVPTPVSTASAASPVTKISSKTETAASAIPTSIEQDRSHLMQGPKHKQDKQAVRENLQSFRQVAHLSARSALAKHSLQQLRNATIAKGVLLAASGIATIWFFGEPLVGRPLQLWKGTACALGLILAAIEFRRSWLQLTKPITAPTPSNSDLETADSESSENLAGSPEMTLTLAEPASVETQDDPTPAGDAAVEAPRESTSASTPE